MGDFQQLVKLIQFGEGLNLEFKQCREKLNLDVFRIIVKVPEFGAEGQNGQKQVLKADTSGAQSGAQWQKMLSLLASEPLSAMDLTEALGLQSKTGSFKRALAELLERKLITYTIPDKPGSRLQKYRLTSKGYEELNKLKKITET